MPISIGWKIDPHLTCYHYNHQLLAIMETQSFNLSWIDFESTASNTFKDLFSDTNFVDVTLACEDDEQIKAHKIILSACSPFFQKVLLKNPHQHPLLYLKGVGVKTLQSILNFIYRGEAEIAQDDLEGFMNTARELKIKGLFDKYETDKKEDSETINPEEAKHIRREESMTLNENMQAAWTNSNDIITLDDMAEDVNQEQLDQDTFAVLSPEILSIYQSFENMQNEEGKFNCKHCDFQTSHKLNLKRHNLNKHFGVKFNCHKCEKVFSLKDSLVRHIKSIHEGLRYPCDQCAHKATQPFDLVAHKKRVHS